MITNSGYVVQNPTGSVAGSLSFNPAVPTAGTPVKEGDQAFAIVIVNGSGGNNWTPPVGWVDLQPGWGQIGTFLVKVYHRTWQAGMGTQTFTMSGTQRYLQGTMFWVSGADAPNVIGTPKDRQGTELLTTTIPGLDTVTPGSRVLTVGFERTTNLETVAITVTGATKWYDLPQPDGNLISTATVAYEDFETPGPTGTTVFNYPHGQSLNGWGFQIALPPAKFAPVREWGLGSPAASHTNVVAHTPAVVPVGHHLMLAAITTGDAAGTMAVSDAKGNPWTVHATESVTGTTTRIFLASAKITSELSPADNINLLFPGVATRMAYAFTEFDQPLVLDKIATNDNGGASTTAVTTGLSGELAQPNELMIAAFGLVNSPRVLTGTNGAIAMPKYVSAVGSGERGIQFLYKAAADQTSQALTGTLDTGGQWRAILATFSVQPEPEPEPAGRIDVLIDGAWQRCEVLGLGLEDGTLLPVELA